MKPTPNDNILFIMGMSLALAFIALALFILLAHLLSPVLLLLDNWLMQEH